MNSYAVERTFSPDGNVLLGSLELEGKGVQRVLFRRLEEKQMPVYRHLHECQARREIGPGALPWVYGVFEALEGVPFPRVVMLEYVDGVCLKDVLERQALDLRLAEGLLLMLGRSLSVLHDRLHLVHGDVKPSNIVLVPAQQRVVLIDLDMASHMDGRGIAKAKGFSPEYACKEQLDGFLGPLTDLRCLALTLLQGLLGHHPFQEKLVSVEDKMAVARTVSSLRLDADAGDAPLIQRLCLATRVEYRDRPMLRALLGERRGQEREANA